MEYTTSGVRDGRQQAVQSRVEEVVSQVGEKALGVFGGELLLLGVLETLLQLDGNVRANESL